MATLSGVAMAIQGTINSQLTQKTSLLSATFAVHLIGTLVAFATILFWKVPIQNHKWFEIPWYYYLGGLLNLAIVALVALSISKIGVCNATTAIIVGQVSIAIIIDHLGLFGTEKMPWSPWHLVGLILFASGSKLLFR